MVKLDTSNDSFYFCTTAGWSTVVKAVDEDSAAVAAISEGINTLEQEAEVSPCIRVKKIKEKFEDEDILIRIDQVFADMGMNEKSRDLTNIIKNIKK